MAMKLKQDLYKVLAHSKCSTNSSYFLVLYSPILSFIFNFIPLFIIEEIKENSEARGVVYHIKDEY